MGFTKEQQYAIDDVGNTILVSASAGSGKTSVLTERIVKRITDKSNPCDISELLVVTFTKSAAAEIRTRLAKVLSEAISKSGDSADKFRLLKQAASVNSAHIDTNDAFFLDVIRQNFDKVGLPAGFSVCDGETAGEILKKVTDVILEERYKNEKTDSDFYLLSECFSGNVDDSGLAKVLEGIRADLRKYKDVSGFFDESIEAYDEIATGKKEFSQSYFGLIIKNVCEYNLKSLSEKMCAAVEEIKNDSDFAPYLPSFSEILDFSDSLISLIDCGEFNTVSHKLADFSFSRLGSAVKGHDKSKTERLKKVRENAKDYIKKELPLYFSADEKKLKALAETYVKILRELKRLYFDVETAYGEEKRKKGLIDFADMPDLCYALMFDKDGNATDIAKGVASQYKEIFIDEYQDTDEIQDAIFAKLEEISGAHRFMVGDVKQSIYEFRGSNPKLFMKYYRSFDKYENDGKTGQNRRIALLHNFRSTPSVINAVNMIFERIMTEKNGGIKYDNNACLIFGERDNSTEENKKKNEEFEKRGRAELIFSVEKTAPAACASKIAELLSDKELGYKPGDIALIFRKRSQMKGFAEALSALNIPVSEDAGKSFFNRAEILLISAVLAAVSNPCEDIPLASAMCSPVFGFSLDELAKIRFGFKGSLIEAVRCYAENDVRTEEFLKKLADYRDFSNSYGIDLLIQKIVYDSGLDKITKRGGTKRYNNIMKLCEMARGFGSDGGYKGLSDFCAYLKELKKNGVLPQSNISSGDGVTMATIHGTKGLEFKVCFVCGLNSPIKLHYDSTVPTLRVRKDTKITFKLLDNSNLLSIKNPFFIIGEKMQLQDEISENVRLLYVALTRAKERLYLSADVKAGEFDKFDNEYADCSEYDVFASPCYFDWIMRALYKIGGIDGMIYGGNSVGKSLYGSVFNENSVSAEYIPWECEENKVKAPEVDVNFVPLTKRIKDIPIKVSVSEITDVEETAEETVKMYERKQNTLPDFMKNSGVKASEIGTAMHAFMQFCNFENTEKDLLSEIENAVSAGFITEKQKSLLDCEKLSDFFKSSLYSEIKKAKSIHREMRFNILKSARELLGEESDRKILLQGVIDCFFESEDGKKIVLLDFKTDRVDSKTGKDVLIERHKDQLKVYKCVIEEMLNKTVDEAYLYSFSLSESVIVNFR